MKKKKGGTTVRKGTNSFVKSILLGTGIGIITQFVLLVISSAVVSGVDEPENFITSTAFVLISVSSYIAGITGAKLSGVKNILLGLASGVLMLLAVWAVSLVTASENGDISLPLKLLIAFNFLFFAVLGAFVGKPSGKIKRRTGR